MDIKKINYAWLMAIVFYLPCCAMRLDKSRCAQLCVSFEDMQINKDACLTVKNKIKTLLQQSIPGEKHNDFGEDYLLYLPRSIKVHDFLAHPVSACFLEAIRNHEDALLKTCVLSTFNITEASLRSLSLGSDSPLFFAVDFKIPALVEVLLYEGGKVDVQDRYGKTPLYYAIKNDHIALARLLLDAGASVAVKDGDGNTPLHYAIKYNNPEMIALLLSKNEANPYVQNGVGADVFFLASQYDFLRSYGMTDVLLITKNIEQRKKCIALLEDWKKKRANK